MNLRGAIVLLALAAATPEIRYFQYQRPVGSPAKAGQTCVTLDAQTFAHGAPGLADLRLYRDATETPYAIREAAPPEQQQRQIAPLNVGSQKGQTVFDAAIPDERYSDVELAVTGRDFIATVTVTGSQTETGGAQTKLGSYTIFDLTGQRLGRSTILHLPESDFRYLHFRIAGPVKPQDVAGLSVERLPAKRLYVTVAETNQSTQKDHETTIAFTVPAHVPVERIEFVPGAQPANFSRDVTIKVDPVVSGKTTDEELPGPIESSGNLLRLHGTHDGHRIDEEHLAMDAPWIDFGTAASKWTLTIDNGDDAPLGLQSVRLEMAERKLCFDAAAGSSYKLYYGDAALAPPRYDYATLFVAEADAAQPALGPEEKNPQFQTRPDTRAFTEKHPALLWVALVLVVVVLGFVALKTAKQAPAHTG